jgi:hypothetical protein
MGANRDNFMAFIKGWSDGAGIKAIRKEFENHPTLRDDYICGYSEGRKARAAAHLAASERYGERIGIVRAPEPIMPTDVAMVALEVSNGRS